ncbi:MAG TPA: hypothetical protein VNT30_13750 [Stellaceae bacterium]|nr:hypothetical protein [Stellaceae bacterium]
MGTMIGLLMFGTSLVSLALGEISLGLPFLGVAVGSGVLMSLRT